MYRTIVVVVAIFIQVTSAQAQMAVGLNKDSLKQLLVTFPPDSNRVQVLITLGQQYEDQNPDSALWYYRQAGTLSEQLNYPTGIVRYINNYTAVLNVQGKFDESVQLNLKAAAISSKYGLRQYEGKAYNNIGAVYQYQEKYAMAIEYYLKAMPLVERYSDLQSQSLLLANLSGVYRNINQSEKGLQYAARALVISKDLKDAYSEAKALINLGNCHRDLNHYTEAKENYEKARSIARDLQDVNTLETSLVNLGNVYLALNQPDKYIPVFQEALPLADSIEDVSGKAFALLGISEGWYARQQWQDAEQQLKEAIQFTREHDQKEVLRKLYLILSDVMVATHRFKESKTYRARHDSVELLLMNESVIKNVQDIEAKYKFEQQQNALLQKDLQLQTTAAESENRKYWLALSFGGVLVLSLMLVVLYNNYRQRQWGHQQAVKALELDKKAVRLQSLIEGQQQERIRISQEIHDDIGSGLTSMLFLSRSLVSTMPSDKVIVNKLNGMATSLIGKMNEIVWAMRTEPEPLDDFVIYLRSTAGEILDNTGIDLQFELKSPVPAMILPADYRHHIHLIVKEAIHNVVKHAQATMVKLSLDFHGAIWKIEVQDNGVGFHEGVGKESGLKSMRRRATAIQGQIFIEHAVGTDVTLEVPAAL